MADKVVMYASAFAVDPRVVRSVFDCVGATNDEEITEELLRLNLAIEKLNKTSPFLVGDVLSELESRGRISDVCEALTSLARCSESEPVQFEREVGRSITNRHMAAENENVPPPRPAPAPLQESHGRAAGRHPPEPSAPQFEGWAPRPHTEAPAAASSTVGAVAARAETAMPAAPPVYSTHATLPARASTSPQAQAPHRAPPAFPPPQRTQATSPEPRQSNPLSTAAAATEPMVEGPVAVLAPVPVHPGVEHSRKDHHKKKQSRSWFSWIWSSGNSDKGSLSPARQSQPDHGVPLRHSSCASDGSRSSRLAQDQTIPSEDDDDDDDGDVDVEGVAMPISITADTGDSDRAGKANAPAASEATLTATTTLQHTAYIPDPRFNFGPEAADDDGMGILDSPPSLLSGGDALRGLPSALSFTETTAAAAPTTTVEKDIDEAEEAVFRAFVSRSDPSAAINLTARAQLHGAQQTDHHQDDESDFDQLLQRFVAKERDGL